MMTDTKEGCTTARVVGATARGTETGITGKSASGGVLGALEVCEFLPD